jgi:hypothetical protein
MPMLVASTPAGGSCSQTEGIFCMSDSCRALTSRCTQPELYLQQRRCGAVQEGAVASSSDMFDTCTVVIMMHALNVVAVLAQSCSTCHP